MVNWTLVFELPSRAVDWISSTPLTERTAASTFWVICVSISVGAAPGWLMLTSIGVSLLLLATGLLYFRRTERTFADVI